MHLFVGAAAPSSSGAFCVHLRHRRASALLLSCFPAGVRCGQWSATVSGNWRLVFEFVDEHATNVDLVDYH
jgi:hypothetical protein